MYMPNLLTHLRGYSPGSRGALFYLLLWGTAGVYEPFLSIHFINLGFSGQQIGILWMFVPFMTLLLAPGISLLVDRYAWRVNALTISLLAFIPIVLWFSIPKDFTAMLLPMLVFAVFRGPLEPLADSINARMASGSGSDYGKMRLWGSLSFAVVVLLCGQLWQLSGYAPMFVLAALCFIPTAISAFSLSEQKTSQSSRQGLRIPPLNRALIVLMICSFLVGTATGMGWTFAGIYMDSLGGGAFMIGVMFALTALFELPSMYYAGKIKQRFSGETVLLASYLLLGLVFAGYIFAIEPFSLILLGIPRGLGFGFFFIITVQMVDERSPAEFSSTLQSLVMGIAAFGLARLLGSPLGGMLYDISPRLPFLACFILVLMASLLLFINRGIFTLKKC